MIDAGAQERLKALLLEKDVGCTLRKQPPQLTSFFYARLRDFSLVVTHPDATDEPRRSLIARLWTMLRFIAKPNDVWRKETLIQRDWPSLESDLATVL